MSGVRSYATLQLNRYTVIAIRSFRGEGVRLHRSRIVLGYCPRIRSRYSSGTRTRTAPFVIEKRLSRRGPFRVLEKPVRSVAFYALSCQKRFSDVFGSISRACAGHLNDVPVSAAYYTRANIYVHIIGILTCPRTKRKCTGVCTSRARARARLSWETTDALRNATH